MTYRTIRGKRNVIGVGEVTLAINPETPDSICISIHSGFRDGSGSAVVPLSKFRAAFKDLEKSIKEQEDD